MRPLTENPVYDRLNHTGVRIMNRIVIDELKRRISSVQLMPVKHCTEFKLEA